MKINTKKSLGQNFIFDKNLLIKISNCIKSKSTNSIIEIGPGLGTLTDFLYIKKYKQLVLIENKWRFSEGYSGYVYDLQTATKDGIIYPSLDPSIFEVKFPNSDIQGRVVGDI